MNPENRWFKKAATIPWLAIEGRHAELFPSETGMPAKPLRTALGSLIIQKQHDHSDRKLVGQIAENPCYQYFIGLPGYQQETPFAPSFLVGFRKRLTADILGEINETIIEFNYPDGVPPTEGGNTSEEESTGADTSDENRGILILDATCAPQQIAFPQDVNLLNEARENLEMIIDAVCYEYNEPKPRMHRQNARRDYLALAKKKKRTGKAICNAIKKQFQCVQSHLKYIDQSVTFRV